uniref:Uncharacterized protein n=1 Tax=Microcebus murinus TaxID=30608 RepID=A0A8C5VQ40_MICMU
MFLHSDSRSSLGSTKPTIVQGVDTHMHQTLGEGVTKDPMHLALQGEDKLGPIPKPTFPSSSLSPHSVWFSSPQMKDHGFPAGRNGLTQTSFTCQVPSGWGSPWGFFLPHQECNPLVRRPSLP